MLVFRLAEAVFPATSVTRTVMASEPWEICSEQVKLPPETVAGIPLQEIEATPEIPSLVRPLTGIFGEVLTLPSAGEVMLTSGGVRSRFKVVLAVTLVPIESRAVP